jgi:hypothetical protein
MPQRQVRPAPPGFHWVFVAWFRHWRSGKLIVAKDYGKEAFCFLVRG